MTGGGRLITPRLRTPHFLPRLVCAIRAATVIRRWPLRRGAWERGRGRAGESGCGVIAARENAGLELLTVREVCAILRCHEKTPYQWVKKESLTGIRIGSKLKFDPADLAALLASCRTG
jgi:excisionase family DNA binding protein